MVTLNILGNKIGVKENYWLRTPFGHKTAVFFNFTGRREKLAQHPKVVARWDLFRSVRPKASSACAGLEGIDKVTCIAKTMSVELRGKA